MCLSLKTERKKCYKQLYSSPQREGLQHIIHEEEKEDNHQGSGKHRAERDLCLWHLACKNMAAAMYLYVAFLISYFDS